MMPLDIAEALEHLSCLVMLQCQFLNAKYGERELEKKELDDLAKTLTPLEGICKATGLNHSQHHCFYIRRELEKEEVNLDMLLHHIHAFRTSFSIDTGERMFLYLEPVQAAALFRDPTDFLGQQVWDKYPDAHHDLSEVPKCFALERYTASVFHILRPLELAVAAVWRSMYNPGTIETLKQGWTAYQRQIEEFMVYKKSGLPARHPDWAKREAFYQQVQGHIDTVTRAWRHRVMHMEARYDKHETGPIIDSTINLFAMIAVHIDQFGNWED